jgi:hypothetical protein
MLIHERVQLCSVPRTKISLIRYGTTKRYNKTLLHQGDVAVRAPMRQFAGHAGVKQSVHGSFQASHFAGAVALRSGLDLQLHHQVVEMDRACSHRPASIGEHDCQGTLHAIPTHRDIAAASMIPQDADASVPFECSPVRFKQPVQVPILLTAKLAVPTAMTFPSRTLECRMQAVSTSVDDHAFISSSQVEGSLNSGASERLEILVPQAWHQGSGPASDPCDRAHSPCTCFTSNGLDATLHASTSPQGLWASWTSLPDHSPCGTLKPVTEEGTSRPKSAAASRVAVPLGSPVHMISGAPRHMPHSEKQHETHCKVGTSLIRADTPCCYVVP